MRFVIYLDKEGQLAAHGPPLEGLPGTASLFFGNWTKEKTVRSCNFAYAGFFDDATLRNWRYTGYERVCEFETAATDEDPPGNQDALRTLVERFDVGPAVMAPEDQFETTLEAMWHFMRGIDTLAPLPDITLFRPGNIQRSRYDFWGAR